MDIIEKELKGLEVALPRIYKDKYWSFTKEQKIEEAERIIIKLEELISRIQNIQSFLAETAVELRGS